MFQLIIAAALLAATVQPDPEAEDENSTFSERRHAAMMAPAGG